MITSAEFVISSPDVNSCPTSRLPEYAFIGRSNVGKSSLINMLCHNPKLAKTSQKPGKTLLINHFLINGKTELNEKPWYLVDLPGYGFAQTGQSEREKLKRMIDRYCLLRENLVSLFVLLDCRLKPQQIDLNFMEWLGEHDVPFAIIFTKTDKIGKGRLSENIGNYKLQLKETWEELPPIFLTSAEKGDGKDEVIQYIEQINNTLITSPRVYDMGR